MKSHPKRLVKRIQSALERPDDIDQLQGLAVEYAALCALVNRRLEQIRAFLEKGQPVVAMELSESTYPLVELTEFLAFPEETAWRELLKSQHLPAAERIVPADVELLRQMYQQHKAESPLLYRDYRAAILRNEEDKARRILRALVRLDEADKNARDELARLERKAIRKAEADLQILMDREDEEKVLEKIREMEQFPWTVGPAGKTWQQALAYRDSIQERRARARVSDLLTEWEEAIRGEDLSAAEERAAEFAAYANQFDLNLAGDDEKRYRAYSAWLREALQQKDLYEEAEQTALAYDQLSAVLESELKKRKNSPLRLQKLKADLDALWQKLLPEQRPGDLEAGHLAFLRRVDDHLSQILAQQRQLALGVIFIGAAALFISFALMFKLQRERQLEASLAAAFAREDVAAVDSALSAWESRRLAIIRTGNAVATYEAARRWRDQINLNLEGSRSLFAEIGRLQWDRVENQQLMNRRALVLNALPEHRTAELENARGEALRLIEQERTRRLAELEREVDAILGEIDANLRLIEVQIRSGLAPEGTMEVIASDRSRAAELLREQNLLRESTAEPQPGLAPIDERIAAINQARLWRREEAQLPLLGSESAYRASLAQIAGIENPLLESPARAREIQAQWQAAPTPTAVWIRPRLLPVLDRITASLDEVLTPTTPLPPESSRIARFLEQDVIGRIWRGSIETLTPDGGAEPEVIFFVGPAENASSQSVGVRTEVTQVLQRASLPDLTDGVIQRTPETLVWITNLDGIPQSGSRLVQGESTPEAVFFRDLANRLRFNERQGTLGRPLIATLDELIERTDLDPGFVAFVAEFLIGLMLERPERWQTWLVPSLQTFQSELAEIRRDRNGLAIWLELPRDSREKRAMNQLLETRRDRPFQAEAGFFWSALQRLHRQPLQFWGGLDTEGNLPARLTAPSVGVLIALNRSGQWDFVALPQEGRWLQTQPGLPFSPLFLFPEDPSVLLESLRGFQAFPRDFVLRGEHLPYRLP